MRLPLQLLAVLFFVVLVVCDSGCAPAGMVPVLLLMALCFIASDDDAHDDGDGDYCRTSETHSNSQALNISSRPRRANSEDISQLKRLPVTVCISRIVG